MQQPETPLELAIASYRAQLHIHTKDRLSMRTIAEDFGVHPSTLSFRLRGVTESYSQGHAYRQALTNDDEHCLLDYIRRMFLLGHPPPPYMVYEVLMRYAGIVFPWIHLPLCPFPFPFLRSVRTGSPSSASVTHRSLVFGLGSSTPHDSMRLPQRS